MAEIRTISNIMSVDEGIITTIGGETFDASEVLGGLAGGTQYTIAAPNSVNKERADLILGTEDPAQEINDTIAMLHNARGGDTSIAIRVDFMGGNIDVGTKTDGDAIVIPLGYDNIHLYGNGVKITGEVYDASGVNVYSVLDSSGNNCILDGFDIYNSGNECGLSNTGTNCTITGNTCSGIGSGLSNSGTNCIITGNTCSGIGSGLSNTGNNCTISGNTCSIGEIGLFNSGTNCTITGNTCSSGDYGDGLYNNTTDTTNKCIIIGNICIDGGISVKTGTCLPATREAMEDVNTGTVTERK